MDLTLLWIALAALVGSILHGLVQPGAPWRQTIITGIITAIVFAAGYNIQGAALNILDLFFAVIGGYGINATVSTSRLGRPMFVYKNKLNQPK